MKGSKLPIVTFEEKGHKYVYNGVEDKKTISVTSLIKKFHPSFDNHYWSTYKALKKILGDDKFKSIRNGMGYDTYPSYLKPPQRFLDNLVSNINPTEFFAEKAAIVATWAESGTKGTMFHMEREKFIYDNGGCENPWTKKFCEAKKYNKEFDNESIIENLYDLEDGIYPELLVWMELDKTVVLGQIDECFIETVDGVRYIDSDDTKSNKSLAKKSSDKFFKPFDHLDSDKMTQYALQATFYNVILESWGFKARNQALTHYKNYDKSTGKRYDLPFYKNEVLMMIDMFNEQNQ